MYDIKRLGDSDLEAAFINAKKGVKKLTGVKLTLAQAKERQALLSENKNIEAELELRFKKYQKEGRAHTIGEQIEKQIKLGNLTEE